MGKMPMLRRCYQSNFTSSGQPSLLPPQCDFLQAHRFPLSRFRLDLQRVFAHGIDHQLFETADRCSSWLNTNLNIAVKHSQNTQATKDALKALQFAKTNYQRHDVVGQDLEPTST